MCRKRLLYPDSEGALTLVTSRLGALGLCQGESGCQVLSGDLSGCRAAVRHCPGFAVRLSDQGSVWTTHRMPRMPEGEGGEARGRLSCSRVIPLWWLKDPVLSHSSVV